MSPTATPSALGKWLLGIRVAAPDGNVPGWGRSVRRWLVPFVVSMVPYIGLILAITVFLRAAFVPDRRGFHDLVAGTTVLRTEHPPVDPRTR